MEPREPQEILQPEIDIETSTLDPVASLEASNISEHNPFSQLRKADVIGH